MAEPPPEVLLRLREADVVRLCGLAAAARGLALVDRHAVVRARREGARLMAVVHDASSGAAASPAAASTTPIGAPAATGAEVWVEITAPTGAIDVAVWGCAHPGDSVTLGVDGARAGLACAHVAALLTAWIRHPADFAAGTAPEVAGRQTGVAARRRGDQPAPSAPHGGRAAATEAGARAHSPGVAEPATGRLALAEELRRLADADRQALARRVLGADADPRQEMAGQIADADPRALTARLASALGDPAFTGALLARLDERAVDLLRGIIFLGNAATDADLGGYAERSELGRSAVEMAVEVLARHGLMFRARAGSGETAGTRGAVGWVVPQEVAEAVGGALPARALAVAGERGPPWLPRADGQPERAARVQPGMTRQVCAAAALLARAPGPVGLADSQGTARGDVGRGETARGGATRASRRAPHEMERRDLARHAGPGGARARPLPPVPGEPAEVDIIGWARGAQLPPGLVRMIRRLLPRAWATGGSAAMLGDLGRLPAADWPLALRAAFRVWLEAETYDELLDLGGEGSAVRARCDPTHAGLRAAALDAENAAARRRVVAAISRLGASHLGVSRLGGGTWIAVADLVDLIWRLDPSFLRGRQRAFEQPAWWFEEASTGRPLRADVGVDWRRAEGRYVTALLAGPLRWWGVVEVAGDPREGDPREGDEGTPYACRFTAMGAYLLGLTEDPPATAEALSRGWGPAVLPARGGTLAIQPLAAGSAALDALAPWTEVSGVAGGRLMLRPSAERAAHELDAGRPPDAAVACLRALDTRDLTHAAGIFAEAVRVWRADYGAARIATGVVALEAGDEATLREALTSLPEVAARCRVVAPTLALVPAADVETLRQALNRRGFVL